MSEIRSRKRLVLTHRERMDAERLRTTWTKFKNSGEYSQKDLARRWGVHVSLISQYINGHIPLNVEAKLWFAKYMRCPAAEIWPDFEFSEAVTMTLPAVSEEAAKLIAALPEDDQGTVLKLLRSLQPRPTQAS